MQPLDANASPMPIADDRRSSEADVVSTLAARVEAIDSLLRATSEVVDEKTLKELRRTIESLAKRDPKFEERVTNKVDVMADRVATLAKTVSTSSAAVVAKQGEIVQLRRELEAGLARVDSAAARLGNGADAAELAEMKRALADLSQLTKQKLPRGLESRVDELAAKLTLLGQRVDTVSTTVSTAASGLAGRDGDAIALRRTVESDRDRVAAELAELRRAVDPTPVDELRQALKAHADETTRRLQATRQLVSQTGAGVDALAGRLDTLTAAVTSATDRVSDTEDGLAAFRSYFESAGGQLSAHLAEHQRSLAALSARAVALEEADEAAARVLDERVAGVARTLAGRLDSFSAALTETESRISGHEEGVSALRAYVDDAGRRLSSLLADQKQSLVALDERAAALERTDDEVARLAAERSSAASDRIDELVERLEPLSAAVETTSARIDARDVELQAVEHRFRDASSRVDHLVADLSRALAELPDPSAVVHTLDLRLDEHAGELAAVADRMSRAEATMSEQRRASASTSAEIGQVLTEAQGTASELSLRLDGLTASLTTLSARAVALEEADEAAARVLDERVAGVARTLAGRLDSFSAALTETESRISGHEEGVSALRAYVDDAGRRLSSLLADQKQSLVALDERAAALERTDDEVVGLSQRVDSLADSVESAASGLGEKERALTSLHRHFTESSTRIESIVDDIRVALSAVPDVGPTTINDLGAYVERIHTDMSSLRGRIDQLESAARETTDGRDRSVGEIAGRIDLIDQRVAAVAAEVARTKTLWPVALRSLEARLDDAVSHRHHTESQPGVQAPSVAADADEHSDDLLAGLRDSLHAMETVAAEMARASDALNGPDDETQAPEPNAPVAAGGATVVPLRTGER